MQECGMYGQGCKSICAADSCNAKRVNYGGKLLVLDRASFDYTRGSTHFAGTPARCCDACKNTTGCNAWV